MMYDKRITVLQVVHPCMGSGQSIMFESLKKNARFWLCCFREVSSRGHPGLLSSESRCTTVLMSDIQPHSIDKWELSGKAVDVIIFIVINSLIILCDIGPSHRILNSRVADTPWRKKT
jgi:hypothetical protein